MRCSAMQRNTKQCPVVPRRAAHGRVASRRIASRRVASRCVACRRVASRRVTSRHVASRRVVSCRVVSCRVVSCRVVSCRVEVLSPYYLSGPCINPVLAPISILLTPGQMKSCYGQKSLELSSYSIM